MADACNKARDRTAMTCTPETKLVNCCMLALSHEGYDALD